ncbi:MAG TPA: hypothetical protein VF134_03350 [Candidatus Dormibacteraeota bacterium]
MPRSPVDVIMGRIGGLPIREITQRVVPCFKYVVDSPTGQEQLALCILIDGRYLYRYPHEKLRGLRSLAQQAAYLRGEREDLRLREFQPGICRYVNHPAGETAVS